MIKLKHIAVHSKSKENAIKFYKDLLGFEIAYEFNVQNKIAEKIFEIAEDFKVIMFEQNNLFVEVFVSNNFKSEGKSINHFCIEIKNRQEFLSNCRQKNVNVTSIDRGDRITVFIKDYDGNLIEVKEKN
jgi:catechol 2,3-dioxygenase-like lactoylglutathione lyase family enzyme